MSTAPDGLTPDAYPWLVGPITASGMGLALRTWPRAAGGLTFQVAADRARAELLRAVGDVGDVVEITATAPSTGASERVWLGRVDDLVYEAAGTVLVVACSDAVTLVQSRLGVTTGWQDHLFPTLARERAVISAEYIDNLPAPGMASAYDESWWQGSAALSTGPFNPGTDLVLNVSNYTYFTDIGLGWDFSTSTATGVALVAPSGGGQPYHVTYTGVDTGTSDLTGLDYPVTYSGNPPDPPFVTFNPAGAASIAPSAWVYGHPFDVLSALITSSGTGTNGPWDVLSADWALRFPTGYFDGFDVLSKKALIRRSDPPADTARYAFWTLKAEDPGVLWRWAAPLGIWPVHRQGMLTLRACCDPHSPYSAAAFAGSIDDGMILAVGAQGRRASGMDVEVNSLSVQVGDWSIPSAAPSVTVYGAGGAAGSMNPRTSPSLQTQELDLTRHILKDVTGLDNDVERRIAPWWSRIAPWAEVELRADALQWCAGDLVRVTSRLLMGEGLTFGVVDAPAMIIPSEQVYLPDTNGVRMVRALLVFLPDW
ncbi:MAG: hypothetical protein ACO3PB_09415 [Miltoncostaeaceae bacterium]